MSSAETTVTGNPLPKVDTKETPIWLIAISILLPTSFAMLATSATNVAIPYIAGYFGSTVDEANWVITIYMIANAILIPLTGWLENYMVEHTCETCHGARLNDDVLFGEVWSREKELDLKTRSIITVVALMSKGILDISLKYHIINAKKNGVSKEEFAEIITHVAFYAGWPNAWAVFNMAKEVYDND